MRKITALLVLAGCGYSEERFEEDYLAAYCAWTVDCSFYDDEQECRDSYVDFREGHADCEYDGAAARQCVNGMEELTCPTVEDEPVQFPDACEAVYLCEDGASVGS